MARAVEVASVICTAVFAGGSLLVSTTVVPSFSAMDPAEFLDWFKTYGPRMGMTLFPFDVGGVVFCGWSFLSALKAGQNQLPWALASACMAGTLVLLPLYFGRANAAFIEKTIDVGQVHAEIASWSSWQWVRTGLSVAAVVAAGWGVLDRPSK
ncbi:DUF1772 domain-containing protein [Polyangium jinanense]|uniref:DUF1772 domain-containing protein n=1 Tax=Polyangium jinanense TaxID=2829994 RepID=A0A9X3XIH2_9BACT|nr:DUF1772 domain-containing protein [Polyangium jinanense]MDC3962406.1 DUF1772 domain-containing protein [Polyangium jinanense]MDC3989298.1 DUF1772 domain-containing protein [Polyangium jinanense]